MDLKLLQSLWQESHGVLAHTLHFLIPLLLLPLTLLLLLRLNRVGNLNLPPSPPKLPIVGNLHQIGSLPHRSFQALSNKHGPLMFLHLGCVPTLVVSSPKMVKEMLKSHDIVIANRARTTAVDIFLNGSTDLVFAPYGEYWRKVKKICVQELLSPDRVQSFQFLREEEVDIMIKKIQCSCLEGKQVNISEMLLTVSNNIVFRTVIGQRNEGEDGKRTYEELWMRVMEEFACFYFRDYFLFLGWTFKDIDALFKLVIKEHKDKMLTTDGGQSDKKNFVEILLQLKEDGILDFDQNQDSIKAILLLSLSLSLSLSSFPSDMFVGSTDTSITIMEWAMAELMKKPNIMKKMVVNDVNQMCYLKCIVKETLQLHYHVPFLVPRETSANAKLGGYDIPCKTRVAEEFLPERFNANNSNPIDFIGQDFQYISFGGGRRVCPGLSSGLKSIEYVLANLLYWFDWEFPGSAIGEELDMSEVFGLSIHKKVHLYLAATPYYP
ncbi:hypothetical protein ACB092_03G065600 [Castanea dentata]